MISATQIQLVKQTWTTLRDVNPELLGQVFYDRLFWESPSLRTLFERPMRDQYTKLVDVLNRVVARIDKPDALLQSIQGLGLLHQQYGVRPEHYTLVGSALLWTLQRGLGHSWTNDIAEAWLAFYDWLAKAMLAEVTTS